MRKQITTAKLTCAAMLSVALMAVGFVPVASAHTGEWAKFNNCPTSNPVAFKCLVSVTQGGKVVLGKKTVPIVNPVTLQGGLTKSSGGFSNMIAATNGVSTLSKTPQPVPGGLAGLVNCKEISNFILRLGCEATFENGLTGVNATLELAKPVSEVKVSEVNLAFEEGTALQMPVKVHLENPFLGSECYVGSASSPIIWNLTTGETSPPVGTAPIFGTGGLAEFKEEAQILQINGAKLVDNGWSAPGASGCGGPIVELLINPIINSTVGVPAAAGKNVAQLENDTISLAQTAAVNAH
jgi:hypothetical protein